MARDYKSAGKKGGSGRGGSVFVGVLIGLVLGLGIALGVAWYINKVPNPFTAKPSPSNTKLDPSKATPDSVTKSTPKVEQKSASVKDDGPRFTAPDILTKGDDASTSQKGDAQKKSTGGPKETFFLQAGSFQNGSDADNLKARLAMVGIEASIQTTTLADKGMWHRVRIGPFADVDQVNNMRNQLKQQGVEASLIKAREAEK